jgi:predicted PurR-regulated permease PerM
VRIQGETAPRWARFLLAIMTIGTAGTLAINIIVGNVAAVAAAAPVYQANLERLLPQLFALVGIEQGPTLGELADRVDITAVIGPISTALGNLVGQIGLVLLYVVFMLLEQESFDRKIDALLPDPAKAAATRALLGAIEGRIETYLRIKTLISLATGALSWLVLALVGVDFAGFWGLLVFMLNFIPTIGSIVAVILPALLTLLQFATVGPVLAVLLGLGAVQFSLGNVLEPRLMGTSLNLSPLVMIVSLALWGTIWGPAGMFLCVPITVILMIVCAHFRPTRPVAILLSATGKVD